MDDEDDDLLDDDLTEFISLPGITDVRRSPTPASPSPIALDLDDDGDGDDEYIPAPNEIAEAQARQDRFNAQAQARFDNAFLGNAFTLPTRYTEGSIGAGQEIVFDDELDAPIGIRNVRSVPRAQRESSFDDVPGGYVNPNVKSFYYQRSFMYRAKKSWASENVPWLFGPEGIYPDIYDCPSDCEENDLCIC